MALSRSFFRGVRSFRDEEMLLLAKLTGPVPDPHQAYTWENLSGLADVE